MATSEARIAANQRNAQKSTGPRTAEGKAASRCNAFRHGLAGAGDVLMPGEDSALVAERAEAFGRELGASGEVGVLLARRAAVLSVRMEAAADREAVAVAARVAAARDQFDRERLDEIDDLIADLDGDDPRAAIAELERSPEGLDHLARAWRAAREAVDSGDREILDAGRRRLARWLGFEAVSAGPDRLRSLIDAELTRLAQLAGRLVGFARALARARDDAGRLASFDPSPEAERARRYEAAAERGMYRAMRAIADLRRDRDRDDLAAAAVLASPLPEPPIPTPRPRDVPPRTTPTAPLASFRVGVPNTPPTFAEAHPKVGEVRYDDPDRRKRRPDPRKLVAAGR